MHTPGRLAIVHPGRMTGNLCWRQNNEPGEFSVAPRCALTTGDWSRARRLCKQRSSSCLKAARISLIRDRGGSGHTILADSPSPAEDCVVQYCSLDASTTSSSISNLADRTPPGRATMLGICERGTSGAGLTTRLVRSLYEVRSTSVHADGTPRTSASCADFRRCRFGHQ